MTVSMLMDASTALDFSRGGLPVCLGLALPTLLVSIDVFVVTHCPKPEWVQEDWPVTFVTDGIQRAIERAKEIAGDKAVSIASATIAQQCFNAGLLDEIHIDLVPFLLGDGVRLFEHLKVTPVALEDPQVSLGKGVIHLTYRVKEEG